jgi:acetyl esterase/lipase
VTDVVDAIRHVRIAAREVGVDAHRVGMLGGSSGGHLALLAALEMSSNTDDAVQVVANWSGAPSTAFIADQDTTLPSIRHSFVNAIGCERATCPQQWSDSSPLERLESTPARFAVLSLGGRDETQVPFTELSAFHERLDELGIENTHLVGVGACHGNSCAARPVAGDGRDGMELTIRFLRAQLASR